MTLRFLTPDQTNLGALVKGMGVSFVKGWYDASLVLVVPGTVAFAHKTCRSRQWVPWVCLPCDA